MIPTEALDISELRVPQEWVDIPNWSADYYAAVQVNVEEGYIRIWGYTSQVNLKEKATYDANEKAYCYRQRRFDFQLEHIMDIAESTLSRRNHQK